MSADNWTLCPQCSIRIERENNEKMKRLYDQYGIVPLDEWKELETLTHSSLQLNELNFREDYDMGVSKDGTFIVSYRGRCRGCSLSFNYKYSTMINLEEK